MKLYIANTVRNRYSRIFIVVSHNDAMPGSTVDSHSAVIAYDIVHVEAVGFTQIL